MDRLITKWHIDYENNNLYAIFPKMLKDNEKDIQ